MKLRTISSLFIGLSLISCGKKAEPFFFIQITDTQMGFMEEGTIKRSVDYLDETVGTINKLHPDFVVVTGDMLNKWDSSEELEAYKGLMAKIDSSIPVYEIPGNHDYRPVTDPGSDKAYLEHFGGSDRFCFVHNNSLFIGINSCYIKDGDTEKEEEQYAWIVEQLKRSGAKADHIFLFTHCPIIKESADEEADYFSFQEPYRSKYLSLCKEYGIDAVFSGHFHRKRAVKYEGTEFVTCTASGFPLGDGFTGINIVAVYPDSFTWSMVPRSEAANPLD